MLHLCIVNEPSTNANINKLETNTIMKKPFSKLALSTDKIVSLTKSQLSHAQGGGPSNSGQSYNCIASNGGQSYNCLAITGTRSCLC